MTSWSNILARGHARIVYHRVWCGSVSYRNKGWDLLQLWNFWVGILCKDILGSNGMFEKALYNRVTNRLWIG